MGFKDKSKKSNTSITNNSNSFNHREKTDQLSSDFLIFLHL